MQVSATMLKVLQLLELTAAAAVNALLHHNSKITALQVV
jgi:hypothetical protein